jgi:PII-like signaling protein
VEANTVKLTSYLSERHRTNDSSAGAALLDLYARREIAASILLRSNEGTALGPHLRSDSSPGHGEDLPVTVTAVDTRDKIEGVLDQTLALSQRGLVTLEPVLLLQEDISAASLTTGESETIELTVHLSRQNRVFSVPAFEEMCWLLWRREIEGATVLLGLDGAARGHRQRHHVGHGNDAPIMVIAVGPASPIGPLLPELGGMLRHPVITLERVRICKHQGQLLSYPGENSDQEKLSSATWQKLIVHSPETSHHGHPVHRAIMRELRAAGIQGTSVHRGLWGFHGEQPPHGDRHLQLRHHVPVITTVVDTAENIALAFGIIDRLTTDQELVTLENVLVMRRASAGP